MHEDLVIFVKGKLVSEERFEEFHGFDSDFEDKRSQIFHILHKGFNAINGHGDSVISLLKLEFFVCTSNEGEQVSRQKLRLRENRNIAVKFPTELF